LLLWAVKKVRPGVQRLLVPYVRFGEQDTELSGQLVHEQAVEEGIVLLAPGAKVWLLMRSSDGFG
jgi:hypothetical protein